VKKPSIQVAFWRFHADNPWVANELERMTDELWRAGRRRVSMKMLFEVLRWESARTTTANDFKLNNNFTAHYARLMMRRRPEWDDMFELRAVRTR